MRCLSKITDAQGNEFNLMQISDFSVITSTIKGYTSPTTTNIWQAGSHTPPSWMSAQGDLLCRCNSSTIADLPQGKMIDNDFLLFKYGRVIQGNDSFYGMGFYNNKNSAARLDTFGDSSISGQTLDCYLGIVLDDDNQRAYILACTDKYNDPSNNKFRIWALAGKYNGTDLYWETFGEVILNQSAGGGGLYGGYKGGAGSGYIGNSLLSNKKMVGYNVPTSSAEGTKTESVNDVSASPVSGKPKSGNGHARIKFLREPDIANMTEWTPDGNFGFSLTYDPTTKENHITGTTNDYWEYYEFELNVEKNTNYTVSLQFKGSDWAYFASYDSLRILNAFLPDSVIREYHGFPYSEYGIAESDVHFSNQGSYTDCSVTFNSGNRTSVWVCLGFGYVWTSRYMDLYFKNIKVTKNN